MQLVHGAVCHAAGTIKLYKRHDHGPGASIYRVGVADFEEVTALRLSDWLRDNCIDPHRCLCLLRMNIEGAEFAVIKDLVESGLAGSIDGYFGMWDDVAKIDAERGDEFGDLLRANGIVPFTFNGRDLKVGSRRQLIRYEVGTSVLAGLRRIGHDHDHLTPRPRRGAVPCVRA